MFSLIGGLYASIAQPRRFRVLLVGPAACGKTALFGAFLHARDAKCAASTPSADSAKAYAPTIGLNTAALHDRGATWTFLDVGGAPRMQALWPAHYADADALVIVVENAADAALFVCHVLEGFLVARGKTGALTVPVLVVLNKADKYASEPLLETPPGRSQPSLFEDDCQVFVAEEHPSRPLAETIRASEPKGPLEDALTRAKTDVNAAADDLEIASIRVVACSAITGFGVSDALDWLQRAVLHAH